MRTWPVVVGALVLCCRALFAAELDREVERDVRALVERLEEAPADRRPRVVEAIVAHGQAGKDCVLALAPEFRSAAHVEVFAESLRRLDRPAFESYLISVVGSDDPLAVKEVAFEQCAEQGSRTIVAPFVGTMPVNMGREKVVAERTLIELFRRLGDRDLFEKALARVANLDGDTRARVVVCTARCESPEALDTLVRSLGRDPGLDLVLLSGIGRCTRWTREPEALYAVRSYLRSSEIRQRREAAVVLGRWRDHESVERIIDLLLEDDRGVLDNARWALSQITGLPFPADHARWSVWFREETTWWTGKGAKSLDALESDDDAEVLRALSEIGKHSLAPPELAPALEALVERSEGAVAARASRLIDRFGLRAPPEGRQ